MLGAYAVAAGLVALVDLVNVLSMLHDAASRGDALAPWQPVTWEATSGLALLAASPLVLVALRAPPPGWRRWLRTLCVHAPASLAFSALHVGLMLALRIAIYAALGLRYHVERGAALYEYRKDLLAYLVLAGVFQLFRGPAPASDGVAAAAPAGPAPPVFDIVEGNRTLRVGPEEILAVKSGGNYAEFHLADGRRPLMRATLSDLAARLGPFGLERTHRSWLVNLHRVRSLEAAGSGDYNLELDTGVQVPLSRRFPEALAQLRRR